MVLYWFVLVDAASLKHTGRQFLHFVARHLHRVQALIPIVRKLHFFGIQIVPCRPIAWQNRSTCIFGAGLEAHLRSVEQISICEMTIVILSAKQNYLITRNHSCSAPSPSRNRVLDVYLLPSSSDAFHEFD